MKLLLITAIEEFENEIKQILKHSGVKSFSMQPVKGYKNDSKNKHENWFGTDDVPIDSLLFMVFVNQESTEELYNKIEIFNKNQESLSRIHLAILTIDQSI